MKKIFTLLIIAILIIPLATQAQKKTKTYFSGWDRIYF